MTLTSEERLRGLSRLGSPMMRGASQRRLDEALDGIERALVGMAVTGEPPDSVADAGQVVGLGRPGRRLELAARALAMLREQLGPADRRARVELERVELPEPRPLPEAIASIVGERHVLTGARGTGSKGGRRRAIPT